MVNIGTDKIVGMLMIVILGLVGGYLMAFAKTELLPTFINATAEPTVYSMWSNTLLVGSIMLPIACLVGVVVMAFGLVKTGKSK